MGTIFQRWNSAKTGLAAEALRLTECVKEADAIIKNSCGQDRQGYYHLPESAIGLNTKYILGLDIQHVDPEKQFNHSLRTAERLLIEARSITTGTLLAAWEKSQEE